VSEISSEQNVHYDAEKSFWMKFVNILELARLDERMLALGGEGGQDANSRRFHSRIVIFADSLSVGGRDPKPSTRQ
jgi:hypothetical protein